MTHIRFSVSAVLVGVAVLALALGALESNSPAVHNLAFTVNLGLLGVAVVGAIVTGAGRRVFWLGFAVFAWSYSLVAFGSLFSSSVYNPSMWWSYSPQTVERRTDLITSDLLGWYGFLRQRVEIGTTVSAPWRGGGYWPATINEMRQGEVFVAWQDGSPGEWVSATQVRPTGRHIDRVGHSLFSPLFGLLGGVVCWYCFADRRTAQSNPRTDTKREEAS